MSAGARIKVLLVDDSAVVRQVLAGILCADPAIELAGAVADPLFALQRMASSWPDVIVLDLEMPRMDGLTFLRRIMAERPTPVVVCSTLTGRGAAVTLEALSAGAFAAVEKPRAGVRQYLLDASAEIVRVVKAAARAKAGNLVNAAGRQVRHQAGAGPEIRARRIVAVGTSTGGTQALEVVLSALPAEAPALLVVQHMPEKFTEAFAARLDSICSVRVKEAEDGEPVLAGRVLIAPGGRHLRLLGPRGSYRAEVRSGPAVHHHRPSVDVLFRSVAQAAGSDALGVLMTGMGSDGAQGLREMQAAGARTVAQDETSSVVFGMPREAIRLGAADVVLPLRGIAAEILGAA